jgi:hypothetical protein
MFGHGKGMQQVALLRSVLKHIDSTQHHQLRFQIQIGTPHESLRQPLRYLPPAERKSISMIYPLWQLHAVLKAARATSVVPTYLAAAHSVLRSVMTTCRQT